MVTKMKFLSKIALIPAFLVAVEFTAHADTMCSVLDYQQAAAVAAALDVLLISSRQIQLLDDSSGEVYKITQADVVPVLDGYTLSVVTTSGYRKTLDLGHIRAINQSAGQSVSLANVARCNP